MLTFGVTQLFRGLRRGQPVLAAFGALLVIWGYSRKRKASGMTLVHKANLKAGKEIRVKVVPDQPTR